MDKDELTSELEKFKTRLSDEVVSAYVERGSSFGEERFDSWRKKFTKFLRDHLPSKVPELNQRLEHYGKVIMDGETDADTFMREDGEPVLAFIDSLILDIKNDELDMTISKTNAMKSNVKPAIGRSKIFIVHGHDEEMKSNVARVLEKLGLEPVILHEQADRGRTVIEKFIGHSDVRFAIVLFSSDDMAYKKGDSAESARPRARQNVVLELGFFIGKLGREHVMALYRDTPHFEFPSDFSGSLYKQYDNGKWQIELVKELRAVGFDVDANKL